MGRLARATIMMGTLAALWAGGGAQALAQPAAGGTPTTPPATTNPTTPTTPTVTARSAQELEQLVGRIALYPDDLLAILLPASTMPLDIVHADRFLAAYKKDPSLKPSDRWDESVRALLNYPEVVSMMSQDLDWTSQLGEAVTSQQAAVISAIQAFRAKAANTGNFKTDDKMIVTQEDQIITITQQDPQVIYVPQYNPTTVVVQQPAPVPYAYYPTPYPCYYYPYAPGAAFASGFFFGAATAFAFNWGGGHVEHNVDIDRTTNMNINRNNPQAQQRVDQARQQGQQRRAESGRTGQQPARATQQGGRAGGGGQAWNPPAGAGQRGGGRADGAGGGGFGGGAGGSLAGQSRPSQPPSGGLGGRAGSPSASPRADGGFGSYGRGADTSNFSSRGAQSRGSACAASGGGFSGGSRGGGGGRGGRR